MGRAKGYTHTDLTKAKLSAIATGRKHSPATIERMRAARLANLARGTGGLSPEGRAALRDRNLGRVESDETRRKKSEAAKKRCARAGLAAKPPPPPPPRKRRELTPEEIRERERGYQKTYRDRLRAARAAERETAELRRAARKAMLIEAFHARKSSRVG